MKDKKKIEILSKVIERVYNKNPGIQKLIYESMLDICKEEGRSPEQVCIFAFLCFWLSRYGLSKHNFFVCKGQLMKILEFVFTGDQNKNQLELFSAGFLKV